jgi:hypothetical protein
VTRTFGRLGVKVIRQIDLRWQAGEFAELGGVGNEVNWRLAEFLNLAV